ncbi:MAG: peptidoglycan bridge formation glycyltransferase FemA/FemB family protein, partial [Bacteroidia bacterium]|nr:peptidoglycan bridge formation glycyltransferase FemA/FemB family protein [Bacteroidia bacterium]
PFGTYITDLSLYPDDDALLGTFDPKYKKAVQHSMKNGARVVFGKDCYDDFYKLYTHTTTRAGIFRDPPAFFEAQRRLLGDRHTETGVVYDGETAIGGIFMLYSRYAALCTHAGSGGESKLYGGMKYLHFEMMKRLRDAGVRYYDLVGVRIGSKNEALEGVFRFKKGFGGQLKEGFLWKADIAPLNVKLYNFIQKVRNKKISGDIIDQESLNEEKA